MLSSAYAQDIAAQTCLNIEIYLKDCCGLKPWSLQNGTVFAWWYWHGQNMLKVNGSCEREVEDSGSDPCSGALIPIRCECFLIAEIKARLSGLRPLHIKLFLQRGAILLLVTEIFFAPCRKPGVWMMAWGTGLNSSFGYNFGRSGFTLSQMPSGQVT